MLEQLILRKDTRIISTNAAEEWGSLKGQATGLEITERNYLSIGNVTKSFTFPPQFQPFWPANFGFLALTEVKKVPFRRKTSLQLLPFHHNFYLSRKGGKAVNSSPASLKPYVWVSGKSYSCDPEGVSDMMDNYKWQNEAFIISAI